MKENYFLDSNFIIGLFNSNDQLHEKIMEILPEINEANCIISELIINEVVTIVGNKTTINDAINVFNYLNSKKFKIINEYEIKHFDFKNMMTYDKYNKDYPKKKRLSYTDCAIITLMKEYDIKKLVSYDQQFNRCENIELINNL